MPDWDVVTRSHVLAAMEEHDRLGSREFLRRYGFRQARAYVVWRNGHEYAAKPILGVSYLHATGQAATPQDFSDGEDEVAKVLIDLGFDVVAEEQPVPPQRTSRAKPKPEPKPESSAAASESAAASVSASASASKPKPKPKPRSSPRKAEPTVQVCPRCFTAVPATGVCDYCD